MNRVRYTFVLMLLVLSIHSFAEGTNAWTAEVERLQILAPTMVNNTNMTEKYRHAMAKFQMEHSLLLPGTTIQILFTAPEGQIVADQPDAMRLTLASFTDDTGKDLLAHMPWERYYPESAYGVYSYGYGHGMPFLSVDISAPGLPSKNATALNIAGKFVVHTAIGREQLVAQNVKLKPGTVFYLGDIKLKVSDAGYDGGQFVIDLESSQDLSSLSDLQFFNKHGKEIPLLDFVTSNFASKGSQPISECDCIFHKRPDTVKIVATHWTGFKKTDVPFTVKTGLGL